MRAVRLQELEELAAKLLATARKLPAGPDRYNALQQIGRFRAQIAAMKGSDEVEAMAESDRNFWTPEEDNRLRTLIEADRPIAFVAADLKRSVNAVRRRAYGLGISLKRVKLRLKVKSK